MEWIEQFYSRQYFLYPPLLGEVGDKHRTNVAAIARLAGRGPKRVLELGAGGGQVAAAMADAGHDVTAVELVEVAFRHARRLAERTRTGSMTVIQGDFYRVEPGGKYDIVCYWDGFGVGSDEDQRRLLRRIAGWLTPGGCALLDIFTPWYWAKTVGQEMQLGPGTRRRYDFDADGCRMLDRWWPVEDERAAVTQSLRCYAPADLRLLLAGTGLALETLEPGGAMDYAAMRYSPRVPLHQAMQYLAKLVPSA